MSAQRRPVLKFSDLAEAPASTPDDNLLRPPSTFKDTVNRAFAGLPPRQADAEREQLIAKGFIAQTFLKKLQPFLEHNFPGIVFHIGPPKDMERAEEKTRLKDKDLSFNCDFSRAMGGLRDLKQIRHAIECFGQRGFVALENADGKKIEFFICDTDDTFSYPDDDKKPGLRNLDIKIAVPMGNRSFHICEFQLIHEGARDAYTKSHLSMEAERLAHKRAAMIENALSITMDAITIARMEKDAEMLAMLEEQQADLDQEYAENALTGAGAREERRNTNIRAAEKCGLDALRKDRPGKPAESARSPVISENFAP